MKAPGQVAFNLTPAMKRALHAVDMGDVIRVYTKDGNVFRKRSADVDGVSYRILWVLLRHRLIEEGDKTYGIETITVMKLSRAGLAALEDRKA